MVEAFSEVLECSDEEWVDTIKHSEEAEEAFQAFNVASIKYTAELRQLMGFKRKLSSELCMLDASRALWALEGLEKLLELVEA